MLRIEELKSVVAVLSTDARSCSLRVVVINLITRSLSLVGNASEDRSPIPPWRKVVATVRVSSTEFKSRVCSVDDDVRLSMGPTLLCSPADLEAPLD